MIEEPRPTLREFQEGLSERLALARVRETPQGMLGVESGGERWLVHLAESGELTPLTYLAPVPLTKPWFVGIANVRGALHGVVDFSAFRGGPRTPQNANARLLLLRSSSETHCALLVDRALGLKSPGDLTALPATANAPAWASACFSDHAGSVWKLLDTMHLLGHPTFLSVGV